MHSLKIIEEFLRSPSVRLLQKENAILILSFIYSEFKAKGRTQIPKGELSQLLENHLRSLAKSEKANFQTDPKHYIDGWQKEENPYLQTLYFDQDYGDWVLEPTITVRQVFRWMEDAEDEGKYGTDIGFLNILNAIKNVVFGTLVDPQEKLKKLNEEKLQIEKQIYAIEETIKKGEKIAQIDSGEIKSKYAAIVRDSKRLIHDFEEIANKYKSLKVEIKDRYNIEKLSRGAVLGSYLETDKKLQENPLVKSFRTFRSYLRPDLEDQLQTLITMIHELPEIKSSTDRFLLRLPTHLGYSSKKVGMIDAEIFSWVKTIFDEKYQENAKLIYQLSQDIKSTIIANKSKFPAQKKFIEIEDKSAIFVDRKLFNPSTKVQFALPQVLKRADSKIDDLNIDFDQRVFINEKVIKTRVSDMVKSSGPISLQQVLTCFPVENGLPELVAYVKIATSNSARCTFNRSIIETVEYADGLFADLPQITFNDELE